MKVIDLILCEDIRKEEGNKLTLCGIYQQNLIVDETVQWPLVFPKFCIMVKIMPEGENYIKGRLLTKREQEPEEALCSFECKDIESKNFIILPFVFNFLSFKKTGKLSFIIELDSGEKKEYFEMKDCLNIIQSNHSQQ